MKIPEKFKLNTEDFKVYFDNVKKTYIAENLETGEKTNIGVLGILMQMGILKPVEEKMEESIRSLSESLKVLETRINMIEKKIDNAGAKESEKLKKEKTKSEIKEKIMKKVLEKVEEKPEKMITENEEEIKTWMEI